MTEEEAKQKWCPAYNRGIYYRNGYPAGSERFDNRPGNYSPPAEPLPRAEDGSCIGQRCMAWRWTYGVPGSVTVQAGQVVAPLERTGGYCGLAGRPNE